MFFITLFALFEISFETHCMLFSNNMLVWKDDVMILKKQTAVEVV